MFGTVIEANDRFLDATGYVTIDAARAADLDDGERQAAHDRATGLPNRVLLASFMRSAIEGPGSGLAVLFLDLDHFKPINDTYGHHVGDHVLAEAASRLRGLLAADQLVARVGGDEFVVAAPNLSEVEVETPRRRLIALVKAPIHYDKGTLTVGLSIGVAVFPDDAATADDLLRCADVALHRSRRRHVARHQGGGVFIPLAEESGLIMPLGSGCCAPPARRRSDGRASASRSTSPRCSSAAATCWRPCGLLSLDGCSEVQGFHLAPPMSAAEVPDLVAQHAPEPVGAG